MRNKNAYYQRLFKIYSFIAKKLTANDNKRLPVREIVYNATKSSDDDGMAYAFNEFFTNIGQSLSDDFKIINCNPLDFLMRNPSSIFLAQGVLRDCSKLEVDLTGGRKTTCLFTHQV